MKPVDYAALTERTCANCKKIKPVSEFYKHKDAKAPLTGWRYASWCRPCSNEYSRRYGTENRERRNARLKRWRDANPEAAQAKDRRARQAKYGLTEEMESEAFKKYNGMCWICRTIPIKARDHDHKTGKFRGMLCHWCNTIVVARADADPMFLINAATYLGQSVPTVVDDTSQNNNPV